MEEKIRRSNRQKKPSLKFVENAALSPRKSTYIDLCTSSESEESDSDRSQTQQKPQVLHENEHVAGAEIFTFQKRKKCEAVIPKTPHAARNKLKKNIQTTILEENSSESDFSESGSEYEVSQKESTTSSSSESTDSDVEIIVLGKFKSKPPLPKQVGNAKSKGSPPKQIGNAKSKEQIGNRKSKRSPLKQIPNVRRGNRSYTIKTDDYFSNHASKKIVTSNHTLDKLETPRLPQDKLQTLLSKLKLSNQHEIAINKLNKCNYSYFEKWMYLMHEGCNILCYGLGSKKRILSAFQEKCLKHLPSVVVHGFFPSLSIKDVLDGIILNLLELKENSANVYECCDLIEKEFSYIPETHLYLIVHNIDMIRGGKAQNIFSRLAAVKNIHLIGSIDHINAPLIWDHTKLSKFNFTWWDTSTFESYIDETSFESSMMIQRTGTLALSSLRNVFLSLTRNSKGIYLILVKYQIENGRQQYYQGLAFKDLYSLCREAFLVSSDLALRAQLTEFVDHKMVKYKRSVDGTENLIIPIPNTVLQQFLTEHT